MFSKHDTDVSLANSLKDSNSELSLCEAPKSGRNLELSNTNLDGTTSHVNESNEKRFPENDLLPNTLENGVSYVSEEDAGASSINDTEVSDGSDDESTVEISSFPTDVYYMNNTDSFLKQFSELVSVNNCAYDSPINDTKEIQHSLDDDFSLIEKCSNKGSRWEENAKSETNEEIVSDPEDKYLLKKSRACHNFFGHLVETRKVKSYYGSYAENESDPLEELFWNENSPVDIPLSSNDNLRKFVQSRNPNRDSSPQQWIPNSKNTIFFFQDDSPIRSHSKSLSRQPKKRK